ncbi:hypothetical protein EJ04DRAFT_517345, partial [Polyplosphaeria fusca]
LQQRGDEVKVTEEVVKAAARNWGSGKEVMELLQQHGGEVKVKLESGPRYGAVSEGYEK